jgi:hypothetical protein
VSHPGSSFGGMDGAEIEVGAGANSLLLADLASSNDGLQDLDFGCLGRDELLGFAREWEPKRRRQ